jgi:signal transduction histidine kinase
LSSTEKLTRRINEIISVRSTEHARRTDCLFLYIFLFQWFLSIVFAVVISPRTWAGTESQIHVHVLAAIVIGGLLTSLPFLLFVKNPGAPLNRNVNAVTQIFFSILLIHLTGGRIETHFHIFGSLAFLASYRDFRPVLIATVMTLLDHLIRGVFWPESVYGVFSADWLRAFEHAGWVAFEDLILFYSIRLATNELNDVAEVQAKQEQSRDDLQDALDTVATLNNLLEEKVHERTAELEESNKKILQQQQSLVTTSKLSALGEMAGGVAHEINNPLGIIHGKASLLLKHLLRGSFTKEMGETEIVKIMSMSDRIAKIVSGLKSFSRNGEQDLKEAVVLQSLLESVFSLCTERFKSHHVDLQVAPIPKVFIECRAIQIEQVVLNLLNNAFDAIAEYQTKWIKIDFAVTAEQVEINVTDCGAGIPKHVVEKMMQPFFTTKEIGKGTGLGLSISSGIIADHGGTLKYDETSANTRFVIVLPLLK